MLYDNLLNGGGSIGPSTLGPSTTGPFGGVSPGMMGSALGGLAGRGVAAALTGSMFGPFGLAAGLLGSAIGYGIGSRGDAGFGTPGFTGQSDPADASIGVSLGGSPDDGSDDGVGGAAGGPGSGAAGGPGSGPGGDGGDGGDGGWADGGLVLAHMLMGENPPGPDDGYGALDTGEYVIRAKAVEKYGPAILDALNRGRIGKSVLAKALLKK